MRLMHVLLPFLALSYQPTAAADESALQGASPQLLSTLNVTASVQSFEVPIPNCGKSLHSVELKILGADVNLQSFGLRFSDGRNLNIPKVATYKVGTDSGWIDLSVFQRVAALCPTAIYAQANASGAATVLLYGIFN